MTVASTVILDTNLITEAISGELLKYIGERLPAEVLRCPDFRVRQLRARYPIIAAWHIAETGQRGPFLHGEV